MLTLTSSTRAGGLFFEGVRMGRPFSFARGATGRDSDGRSGFAGIFPASQLRHSPGISPVFPRVSQPIPAGIRCRFTTIEECVFCRSDGPPIVSHAGT